MFYDDSVEACLPPLFPSETQGFLDAREAHRGGSRLEPSEAKTCGEGYYEMFKQ